MSAQGRPAGMLQAIWRYPVKSMQGESLTEAPIDERGVLGDRAYALLDRETGHVASAKHPRKWALLLQCRAAYLEPPRAGEPPPPLRITLPDGAPLLGDGSGVDDALSALLGQPVALVSRPPDQPTREANRAPLDAPEGQETILAEPLALAAPSGTFFDYAPLHVLTSATLRRLRSLYPAGSFDVRRFRPNLLLETPAVEGFVESGWPGRQIAVGDGARLLLIDPCPRCVVTTLAQAELPRDPGILRALAHSEAPSFTLAPGVVFSAVAGAYARALSGGIIRVGDAVRLV